MRGQRNTEVNSPDGESEEKKGAQEKNATEKERGEERERESRVKETAYFFLIVKNRKTNRGRASTLVTKRRFIKN